MVVEVRWSEVSLYTDYLLLLSQLAFHLGPRLSDLDADFKGVGKMKDRFEGVYDHGTTPTTIRTNDLPETSLV